MKVYQGGMFNKVGTIKDEILMTIPKDYFFRKVDKDNDFKFIYDLIKEYYSHTSGRNRNRSCN